MKKGKKLTATMTAYAVVAALVLPTAASASTVTLTDISGSFAKDAIQKLADAGIVHGTDGKYNPQGTINKQDFVIILVNALGLDVSAPPATASFNDVPTTSYAFKYVEAAKKAGIVHGDENGNFGYNTNLQRQQMALMFANATGADIKGKASNLTFSDKGSIGSWAADAVGYAVENGWIHGYNNMFNPTGSATRAEVAVVASSFLDTVSKGDLKITASKTNVAVGEKVQFSVTGASNVQWSVTGNAVIDQAGNFVASEAGSYTVTANVNGKTLTQAVSVYGVAAGVKVGTLTDLVASGKASEVATITVVDANGNPVSNFNGTLDVQIGGVAAKLANSSTVDFGSGVNTLTGVAVTNGVATVTLYGATTPGLTDTLNVNNVLATGAANALQSVYTSATVKTAAQVATSIKVTAPSTIGVNTGAEKATVSAQVVDQAGNPMLTGVYPVTFHIAGSSATFLVGGVATTDDQTATIVNNSTPSVTIQSVKAATGASTITVTSGNLTGTASVNGAVVADASKLAFAIDSTSDVSFVQGGNALFDVTTQDAAGNTTTSLAPTTTAVKVTNTDGTPATNLLVSGNAVDSNGEYVIGNATTFTVSATAGANAGTYNVQVIDTATSGAKTAAAAQQITIKADVADHITATAAAPYVAASSTADTVKVQVVDVNGNPVAKAGQAVTFYATNGGVTGTATLNGVTQDGVTTTNTVTVTTDSNGVASVNLTPQSYTAVWNVYASTSGLNTNTTNTSVHVVPMVTAKLGVTLKTVGGTYNNSTTTANAGDSLQVQVAQQDQYGNLIPVGQNDKVKVTISPANGIKGLLSSSQGNVTVTSDSAANTVSYEGTVSDVNSALSGLTAGKAGAVTVTATDESFTSATTGSSTINVLAQNLASNVRVLTPNNDSNSYTVATAGEVGPFTVQLVDAGGNPAVSATDVYVSTAQINSLLHGTGYTGQVTGMVRTSANGVDSGSVKIPAGSTQVQVWVNVSTAGVLVPASAAALNTVTPSVGAVTATTVSGANKAAYGFTVAVGGSANGATATITDGATTVNATATVSGATATFSNVDLSSLVDGNLTIVVTATDAANNSAASAPQTVVKDTVAPTVTTALTNGNTTGIAAANGTGTIVFSETLSAAAQTAVDNAIATATTGASSADLIFSWTGATLTITNTNATTAATFGASAVTAAIADAAGNTTAAATIVTP